MGGTGLYFKSLTEGMVSIPNIPIQLRKKIRLLHKKLGPKKFFLKLIQIDPLVKKNISPSDTQRCIRAYEIKLFTKKSIYNWFKSTKSDHDQKDFYKIYIDFPRNDLVKKISLRSREMIKKGAISEVKKFIALKISKDKSVNKAIGISEVKDYLHKKTEINDLVEKISIKTRQYAKRQSTWARGNMIDWKKINPNALSQILKKK